MEEGGPPPEENPGEELVGQVLAGRYRILEMLGEGAMGAVYLAEHLHIGRRDAIKVLRPALSKDPEAIARFTRGARNASRVRHPNVCSIYDFGESEGGMAFLAMEYIDGESLQDLLRREGHLPVEECVHIMHQTADALQAAHEAGIIHRDLKPGNIMLTRGRGGRRMVKVVDFDIAKGSSEGQGSDLTQMGLVIGTPEYMSPEQLTADALDGRSDVYSLGMVLFRMLTGVLPFAARTTREIMLQRLTAAPGTLAGAVPDRTFPPGLQAVLDRALARSPEERFPDADAFAEALEAAAKGGTAPGSPPRPAPASGSATPPSGTGSTGPASPEATVRSAVSSPPVPRRAEPSGPATIRTPAASPATSAPKPTKRGWGLPLALVAVAAAVVAGVFVLAPSGELPELDLLPAQAVLGDGERIQITAAVTGSVDPEAREAGFEWTSSDPSVATVDEDGVVTGVGPGTAEIIARIGSLAAAADVTVAPGRTEEPDPGAEARPSGPGPGRPASGGPGGFAVEPGRLTLSAVEGIDPDVLPTGFVTVTGVEAGAVEVEIAYPEGGAAGWLNAQVAPGPGRVGLTLRASPSGVPVGLHEARVDVSAGDGVQRTVRVFLDKAAAPTEEAGIPLSELGALLDRLDDRLLDDPDPGTLAAVNDTARAVWAMEGAASEAARARAAFYAAQAESALGNRAAARDWAERAVTLAPDNDGYRLLLASLGGGRP